MTTTTTTLLVLESLTCGVCCIPFALEAAHLRKLRDTGALFYCPNGHHIAFTNSAVDKLRAQLLRAESSRDYWAKQVAERQREVVVHKRRATRFKNDRDRVARRTSHGVCPVKGCRRHFADLDAHMATKHPAYVATEDARATEQA